MNESILRSCKYLDEHPERLERVLEFLDEDKETGMISVDWNKFVFLERETGSESPFYTDLINYMMSQGILTYSNDETYALVRMNSLRGPFTSGAIALNFGIKEDALAYNKARYNGGEGSIVKLSKA